MMNQYPIRIKEMTLDEIQNIRIEDFDYPLPDERIARHPLAVRDACKLLVCRDRRISHRVFSDLPDLIPAGTLLVMNNTRVINARMEFFRQSGARIEIFLLEPLDPRDYAVAFQTRTRCSWQCMVGNLKKWKDEWLEKRLVVDGREITLKAIRHQPMPGNSHEVEFQWSDPDVTFASIVEAAGAIPIPPYLKRESEKSDSTDYQTVYSRIQGSVAAPTAGLHFTPQLLEQLRSRDVATREVTLHVGAGTFQPVKSDDIGSHPMHTEVFEVEKDLVVTLRRALEECRDIMAVGTTTVRTLESLPILGLQLMRGDESLKVSQWEAYSLLESESASQPQHHAPQAQATAASTIEALRALEDYMERMGEQRLTASTAIMIAPGFPWRIVKGMVTNFHQPQSTLLLLVSSLLDGDNLRNPLWRRVYQEALDNAYRFLSYGDACLFLPPASDPDQPEKPKKSETSGDPASPDGKVIDLPGSKSIAARALICRLLSGHDTRLGNLPHCGDTDGMLRLTEAVRNAASSRQPASVDIGEGGTTLRFGLAACASIAGLDITLSGSPRLMERPHGRLIEALAAVGADITPLPDRNAIRIKGRELRGGLIRLDGSVSSQFVSALMLAAPTWAADTQLLLQRPVVSFPYVEMTAGVMRAFGANVDIEHDDIYIKVSVKATGYAQCARYDVEGDWSAASYFFETRLIDLAMRNGDAPAIHFSMPSLKAPVESLQGDSRVAAIFAEAIGRLRDNTPGTMTIDLRDTPDLAPALAVGLCLAGICWRFEGVAHLRVKETDRMAALSAELRRLGFMLECGDDWMQWTGARCAPEQSPLIRTYQDHRMAMAFAPARLLFPTLRIENPDTVAKSFPRFWDEIAKLIPQPQ